MSRKPDPRILEILAIYDRSCASATVTESPGIPSSCACSIMAVADHERFDKWPHDALRELLAKYLEITPRSEIAAALADARGHARWLKSFEVRAYIEGHGVLMESVLAPSAREAARIAKAEANA